MKIKIIQNYTAESCIHTLERYTLTWPMQGGVGMVSYHRLLTFVFNLMVVIFFS